MKIIRAEGAKRPRKATKGSAGYDIASLETLVIPPGCHAKVHTGLRFEIPRNCVGTISHRSGMNTKQGIQAYGRVDSDYQGEVCVTLFNNHPSKEIRIEDGDYIAQIVFVNISHHTFKEVSSFEYVTERGEGGYGSTGK